MADEADLEAMAAALEASGRYRVLRKLAVREGDAGDAEGATRSGLFVDLETTGLEPERHEIIELAMVPFTYGLDGQVLAIGQPFHALREPSRAIPPEITHITGLDDAAVAGHRIDPLEVALVLRGLHHQGLGLLDVASRLDGGGL